MVLSEYFKTMQKDTNNSVENNIVELTIRLCKIRPNIFGGFKESKSTQKHYLINKSSICCKRDVLRAFEAKMSIELSDLEFVMSVFV